MTEPAPAPLPAPPKIPRRALILAVPIAMGVFVVGSGVAWIVAIQLTQGEARGARVRTTVSAACDAVPVLVARLDDFGLAPLVTGDTLEFSLPGLDDDMTHMASTLTSPGILTVGGTPQVPNHAGVQISLQGAAVTLLTLDAVVPESAEIALDGVTMQVVESNGGELQLAAWAANSSDALRTATDRAVAMRHPLPCAVSLSPLTTP